MNHWDYPNHPHIDTRTSWIESKQRTKIERGLIQSTTSPANIFPIPSNKFNVHLNWKGRLKFIRIEKWLLLGMHRSWATSQNSLHTINYLEAMHCMQTQHILFRHFLEAWAAMANSMPATITNYYSMRIMIATVIVHPFRCPSAVWYRCFCMRLCALLACLAIRSSFMWCCAFPKCKRLPICTFWIWLLRTNAFSLAYRFWLWPCIRVSGHLAKECAKRIWFRHQ